MSRIRPDHTVTRQLNDTERVIVAETAQKRMNWRNKKVLVTAGSVGAMLIVGFGSWAVYALWYQNLEKIVADALMNAISAKSIAFDGTGRGGDATKSYSQKMSGQMSNEEGANLTFALTSKPVSTGSEEKIGVDIIHDPKGVDYLKLNNAKNLAPYITTHLEESMAENSAGKKVIQNMLDFFLLPILGKVDNEWIQLTHADIKRLDARIGEGYECLDNTIKSLGNDAGMQRELGEKYRSNKFLVIQKTDSKSGKLHVTVKLDKTAAQRFLDSLKTAKVYKDLASCYQNTKQLLEDVTKQVKDLPNDLVVLMEIDEWTHQMTKFQLDAKDKASTMSYDISLQFDKPVKVTAPKESMSFDDAVRELAEILSDNPNSTQSLMSRGII